MLTPDQVRLRLAAIHYHESDSGMANLVTLLDELLPELVAAVQKTDDAGSRYGSAEPALRERERRAE